MPRHDPPVTTGSARNKPAVPAASSNQAVSISLPHTDPTGEPEHRRTATTTDEAALKRALPIEDVAAGRNLPDSSDEASSVEAESVGTNPPFTELDPERTSRTERNGLSRLRSEQAAPTVAAGGTAPLNPAGQSPLKPGFAGGHSPLKPGFAGSHGPWYRSPIGSLAIVLGVIGAAFWAVRRWAPTLRPAASSVVKVVARSSLGPRQNLALIQLGRRFVLTAVSGSRVDVLCEVSDIHEVAELAALTESSLPGGATAFDTLLNERADKSDRDELVSDDELGDPATPGLKGLCPTAEDSGRSSLSARRNANRVGSGTDYAGGGSPTAPVAELLSRLKALRRSA